MAPNGKYTCTVRFTLSTEAEPDGCIRWNDETNLTSEEGSNSESDTMRVEYVTVIEFLADSLSEAEDTANTLAANADFESHDGLEWEIEDFTVEDLECVEAPLPSLEEAVRTLRNWANDQRVSEPEDPIAAALIVLLESAGYSSAVRSL